MASEPRLGAEGRDGRRIVLEQLAKGYRLRVTELSADRISLSWVGDVPHRLPHVRVFFRLSRERLIQTVRGAGDVGTRDWEISPLGLRALRAAAEASRSR